MPTAIGVLQAYREGQKIFRRESVACLVARIEQLEKYVAAQQPRALDKCPRCDGKGYFYIGGIPRIYCDDCNGSGICQ